MKDNNQKIKLLKLTEYLRSEASEESPASTKQIISYLESVGTTCDRRTLYHDMEFLAENGIDVIKTTRGKENAYYIDSKAFSLAEIKILTDAVLASDFITDKKTKELVDKIVALAGVRKREILSDNIIFYNTHKHTNEDIFTNIEQIGLAVKNKKQISFYYFDLDEDKKRAYRKEKKRYTADPVALVFSDDNYYLVSYSRKYKAVTNYRVDRMEDILVEDEDICAEAKVKKGSAASYMKQVFRMYNGDAKEVTLEFDREILGAVYDRFGEDQPVKRTAGGMLCTKVTVQVSPPFLAWVSQFGEKMKLIEG